MRTDLAALFLCACIVAGSADVGKRLAGQALRGLHSIPSSPPLFRHSSDVGVTHCAFPAIVEDEPVLLHMWLRVFLRAPAAPQPQGMQQQQQQQPSVHAHVKGFATIESLSLAKREDWSFHSEDHTGPLSKKLRPVIYMRPMDSDLKYNLTVSRPFLYSITGEFELQHATGEFEVGMYDMLYICNVVATWEEPNPMHNRTSAAGLEKPGQTAMLLSPFFCRTSMEAASLLLWHMSWHTKLGVDVYIVYATQHLLELVEVPQIQALVQAGLLHLILWQDMALPDASQTSKKYSRYGHQTQIYNHALLALHAKDTIVLVADLDEYLVTPQPMTVKQMIAECAPGKVVGAMRLKRYNTYNPQSASEGKREVELWLDHVQGAAMLPKLSDHPLRMYWMCSDCSMTDKYAFKSIYDASRVSGVSVHFGFADKDAFEGEGSPACAHWLHVVNQVHYRLPHNPAVVPFDRKWLWPLESARA